LGKRKNIILKNTGERIYYLEKERKEQIIFDKNLEEGNNYS
jgi:hypothetical protein